MAYPLSRQTETFGAALFWAEEYWATTKLQSLRKKKPNLDFSGFINTSFQNRLPTLLKETPHTKMLGTRNYHDLEQISSPLWENKRRFINLSSSHAPSRVIAEKYSQEYGEDFGIITLDAHLDLTNTPYIHANWLTEALMGKTAVVGGWAEASSDREQGQHVLKFLVPSLFTLLDDPGFRSWLSGKKIYVTIDLDYFDDGQHPFLGYATYIHREKIIGHALNIDQLIEAELGENRHSRWLGTLFNYSNLGEFIALKKKSIQNASSELVQVLTQFVELFKNTPTMSLLALDLVEYSPICDWHNLTLNELVGHYPRLWNLFHSFRAEGLF